MLITTSVKDIATKALNNLGYMDPENIKNIPIKILKTLKYKNFKIEADSYAYIDNMYFGLGDVIDHDTVMFKTALTFPSYTDDSSKFLDHSIMLKCVATRSGDVTIHIGDELIAFTDVIMKLEGIEKDMLDELAEFNMQYYDAIDNYCTRFNIMHIVFCIISAIIMFAGFIGLLLTFNADGILKYIAAGVAIFGVACIFAAYHVEEISKDFCDTVKGKKMREQGKEILMRIMKKEKGI